MFTLNDFRGSIPFYGGFEYSSAIQKQQEGQLSGTVAVNQTRIGQGIAEVPDFGDYKRCTVINF